MTTYLRDLVARLRWTVDDDALKRNDRLVNRQKRAANDLQRSIVRTGNAIATGLAAAGVVRELERASDASITFARSLADLQSLLPGQTERVEELGAGIRKLAVQYGADAVTLSKATYQIISSTGDGAETLDRLRLSLELGKSTMTDAATAYDLISAVTLAYGDASIEAQKKVADFALTTVRLGNTTLPQVTAAIGRAAPAFAALGVSQQELFGLTATLAGVTGSTAEAMTQLSAVAAGVTKRTKEMDAAFKTLGVKTAKELISKKGLQGALLALRATTKGTAEELSALFGREEATRGVSQLVGASAQKANDNIATVGKNLGIVGKGYADMATGAGAAAFEVDKLKARSAELQLQLGERVTKPMLEGKIAAQELAEAISKDLFGAFDVFSAEADEFAQSPGFDAILAARALVTGASALADFGATALGVAGGDIAALGAAGATALTGDFAGAGAALALREREHSTQTRELGRRLSFRGAQIRGAFGDTEASDMVDRRRELARLAMTARRERDRAFEERDISRTPGEIRRRRLGQPSATINNATIVVPPGTSPEQAQQIVRRGFGEALGDALAAEVPDQTATGG